MWWVIGIFAVSIGMLGYLFYTAVEGYEDSEGFHYGPDPFIASDKPRCAVTGQPLTASEQFEQECE